MDDIHEDRERLAELILLRKNFARRLAKRSVFEDKSEEYLGGSVKLLNVLIDTMETIIQFKKENEAKM